MEHLSKRNKGVFIFCVFYFQDMQLSHMGYAMFKGFTDLTTSAFNIGTMGAS